MITVAYLYIRLGFIGNLHDKFSLRVDHVLKDLLINSTGRGTQKRKLAR